MNRRDIQELRVHVGYPAITLIMKCDKAKIKEKFLDVVNQIKQSEGVDAPLIASFIAQFDILFDEVIACPANGKSIALFVNKHTARFYALPFDIDDVVACDQTFKLDAISAQLNRLKRYWMIDCSAKKMKLFEGVGDCFIEVGKDRAGLEVFEKSELNPFERDPEQFDAYLGDYLEQDALPICLVGSAQETQALRLNSLLRNHMNITVTAISDVKLAMNNYFEQEVEAALQKLDSMVEGADFVTRLQDVLYASRQGQVKQLLVEEGYHFDACEEPVTRQVTTEQSVCPVGYQKISLVDQIIESVRSKGGSILIVPDGKLQTHDRLVAFIRFF